MGLRGDDDADYNDYDHGDDAEDSVEYQNDNNNIVGLELGQLACVGSQRCKAAVVGRPLP